MDPGSSQRAARAACQPRPVLRGSERSQRPSFQAEATSGHPARAARLLLVRVVEEAVAARGFSLQQDREEMERRSARTPVLAQHRTRARVLEAAPAVRARRTRAARAQQG